MARTVVVPTVGAHTIYWQHVKQYLNYKSHTGQGWSHHAMLAIVDY